MSLGFGAHLAPGIRATTTRQDIQGPHTERRERTNAQLVATAMQQANRSPSCTRRPPRLPPCVFPGGHLSDPPDLARARTGGSECRREVWTSSQRGAMAHTCADPRARQGGGRPERPCGKLAVPPPRGAADKASAPGRRTAWRPQTPRPAPSGQPQGDCPPGLEGRSDTATQNNKRAPRTPPLALRKRQALAVCTHSCNVCLSDAVTCTVLSLHTCTHFLKTTGPLSGAGSAMAQNACPRRSPRTPQPRKHRGRRSMSNHATTARAGGRSPRTRARPRNWGVCLPNSCFTLSVNTGR